MGLPLFSLIIFLDVHDNIVKSAILLLESGKPIICVLCLCLRHTGVVVYGNEYYFGGGIQHSPAGLTPYGTPLRVVDLGVTHVPKDVFEMYLQEISPRYLPETYSLLTHNCNNFSNEVAQFLVGASIPEYILQLPNEVMSSPMGALICELSPLTLQVLFRMWIVFFKVCQIFLTQ